MTVRRHALRAVQAALWCTLACVAQAGGQAMRISSQPLGQALAQFDALTGVSVFYPSELVVGRISAVVQGQYSADEALRAMLRGTGLQARHVAPDAYVLAERQPEPAGPSAQPSYGGLLQSRVQRALCAEPTLALGSYRLALSLQVDPAGAVRQARLLDTTGDAARDAAILRALSRVQVGRGPASPDRPFVLLVQPREGGACPQGRSESSNNDEPAGGRGNVR
ncbi:STN domain-containing protein [Bordetella genomosp. 13]|uniref:Secretin/TonB short N-terminal domain-containing protein n=1 Tax=Bordetella genomosp. 13 TaxID=463040 RepID=A0A1W6ZD82_9BORD|nr:STN domain-containing protein [Bordetella genomosp. 13]ARP95267.1 hypothetical protein CAL15_13260 [Bordetella genomosp. 13]